MPRILDVEQAMLLLELEAPFDQRQVLLARRRMAKRWHPDIAPPGRQHEHQRHLQAINEAADQLQQLAETSRGGRVTRTAVKVSAAATRRAREEAGRRAYEEEQRARASAADRATHDPFGSRVPDHSVVHRYARCLSYPEWGVGNFGDNPFFIQQMHDWFVKNQGNIAYAAYFDVDGLWPTQIDNNQFPRSRELFRKLFGRSS